MFNSWESLNNLDFFFKNLGNKAGDMAQFSRTLAISESWGSVSRTYMVTPNCLWLQFQGTWHPHTKHHEGKNTNVHTWKEFLKNLGNNNRGLTFDFILVVINKTFHLNQNVNCCLSLHLSLVMAELNILADSITTIKAKEKYPLKRSRELPFH